MLLPYGITGFSSSKEGSPPEIDGKVLKNICYEIINRNEGRILDFKKLQYPANFYLFDIFVFHKNIHILVNNHYPFMAFASYVDLSTNSFTFINEPKLTKEFNPYYKILSVDQLNQPLIYKEEKGHRFLENVNELNGAELSQIYYWKPNKISEVIFNFWD